MDDAALAVWLRLREQADWNVRSVVLTQAVVARLPHERPLDVLDLGSGAGSNLRYLAGCLPMPQRWLLIDRSAALLSEAEVRTRAWAGERRYEVHPLTPRCVTFPAAAVEVVSPAAQFAIAGPHFDCHVEMRVQDLGTLDDPSMFAGRHLVTASALLDLVSESWLRTLASRCRLAGASALFTITYDGRFSCVPAEPEDELVRGLMNAHQRRDKGLGGPAEGPGAVACAVRCFSEEGYEVSTETSDWALGRGEEVMQRMLIDGWARAASEQSPDADEMIASWRARRLAHVDAERSHIVVGHRDVAAWL